MFVTATPLTSDGVTVARPVSVTPENAANPRINHVVLTIDCVLPFSAVVETVYVPLAPCAIA